MHKIGGANEGGVAGHPPLFWNQPGKRKAHLGIALAIRYPKDLHVVRPSHQTHWRLDRFRHGFARAGEPDPFHPHEVLLVGLEQREPSRVVGEHDMAKVRLNGPGQGQLRHGAVKTAMPAGVLILMTFAAGVRTDISLDATLLGQQIGEGRFGGGLQIGGYAFAGDTVNGAAVGTAPILLRRCRWRIVARTTTGDQQEDQAEQQKLWEWKHGDSMEQMGDKGNENPRKAARTPGLSFGRWNPRIAMGCNEAIPTDGSATKANEGNEGELLPSASVNPLLWTLASGVELCQDSLDEHPFRIPGSGGRHCTACG